MAGDNNRTLFTLLGTAIMGLVAGGGLYAIEKMESGGMNFASPPPEPSLKEFEVACEFLSLPADVSFSEPDVKKKVKELYATYHPDRAQSDQEKSRFTKICQRIAWAEQVVDNKMREGSGGWAPQSA